MTYFEGFLERNKAKPFVRNLVNYENISRAEKLKALSSFLTHLFIDQELGHDNNSLAVDVLALLTQLLLYGQDNFLPWFESHLSQ